MNLLQSRILKSAKVLEGNIIKVDSFLNHQLDIAFLEELAKDIKSHFKDKKIDKILTIEASGIALASILAMHFDKVPVLFCKKQKTLNIAEDVYESKVESFTTKKSYTVTANRKFISEGEKVLIVDDFLAEGNALNGLIDIANQAGAKIEGIAIAIEKGFQEGGKNIRDLGYELYSLAVIDSIEDGVIKFRDL